jgi:hypothetical protein
MAWQDELNSLDEELSAGRIRSDEYRRRRDELLAAASSNPGGVRRNHRQQPVSIANAFTGDPKPEASSEVTQQVEVPETAWQAKPPENGQLPAPKDLPPHELIPAPPQPMQGAEVFGLAVGGPSRSRKWPRFVVAIVVLALIAGATWWFAFRDKTGPAAGGTATAGQLSVDSLPNPTDVPLSYSGTLTVDQMQIYNLAQPDEAAFLADAGTDQVYYRGVTAQNLVYHIYAFRTRDADTSRTLMAKVVDRSKRLGRTSLTVDGVPAKVTTQQVFSDTTGVYEAVYVSGRAMVHIFINQGGPHDEQKLGSALKRSVEAVTHSIPPS